MKTTKIKLIVYSSILACVFASGITATPVKACESATLQSSSVKHVQMLRLYNSYSGEHFYTSNANEKANLVKAGWTYEGEGWVAPVDSKSPVYRLYNKYVEGGDHHYTMDKSEYDKLIKLGWSGEGVGWYSDDNKEVALLRQYNPNAQVGTHNFTTSTDENASLVREGWSAEGVSWYGVAGNSHSWTLKTETIHHDAVTKQEENWVMETHHVCGICGKISDPSKGKK